MWDAKHLLERLIAGGALSFDDARELAGHVAADDVDHAQLAAILALLAAAGESADVVAGFATAMRAAAVRVTPPPGVGPLLDIVGTGGDGLNTVNISTASAVVAAAAGATVAKHGSLSVSSRSGAADVLSSLGVAMLGPAGVAECLRRTGLAFMFAPLFHPALRAVVPLRRALKVRTVFNVLGPLLNPAGAGRLLLGVYKPALLPVYGHALARLGVQRALVVHCCGLDELAPIGPTQAVEVVGGADGGEATITHLTIDPAEWGVPRCTVDDLLGGGPAENAAIITSTLAGGGRDTHAQPSHVARTIALNAGAALYVYGTAPTLAAGYALALETIASGKAGALLSSWSATTRELAAAEAAAAAAAAEATQAAGAAHGGAAATATS
jgi:anthranilate phosphoribosyltransferase